MNAQLVLSKLITHGEITVKRSGGSVECVFECVFEKSEMIVIRIDKFYPCMKACK